MIALALKYLRLADLAEKNARVDIAYETPSITVPMQQQQQQQRQPQPQPRPEQQQQQAAKPDPSDEK